MTIKDDMIEQDMIDKDVCFICHEQNDDCECNNPDFYEQNIRAVDKRNTDDKGE